MFVERADLSGSVHCDVMMRSSFSQYLVTDLSDLCAMSLRDARREAINDAADVVALEYWLLGLVRSNVSDLRLLLEHLGVSTKDLIGRLHLTVGAVTIDEDAPSLIPPGRIHRLLEAAWLRANFGIEARQRVRSSHLLMALLDTPQVQLQSWSPLLSSVSSSAVAAAASKVTPLHGTREIWS